MKCSRLVTLTLLSLSLGCAARQKSITNLPPGVTQAQVQSWDSAVANLNKIAVANSGAQKLIIQLHGTLQSDGTPVFPSGPAYIAALDTVGRIDQIENAASNFLANTPNNWSDSTKTQISNYMQQISSLVQTLNSQGVIGIKNSNSQNQVNTLIKEITASITIILSL